MAECNPWEADVSRFLPAGFHAHLVFSLAGRAGIIFHAGALLVGAHFAARLLSLRRIVGSIETGQHQQRDRKKSHDMFSSLSVETEKP
jgi:hypothetical protein